MAEATSPEIAALASKGLDDPASLTPEQVRRVCASALTQREDPRSYGPDDESHGETEAEARGAAAERVRALKLAEEIEREQASLQSTANNHISHSLFQGGLDAIRDFARRMEEVKS